MKIANYPTPARIRQLFDYDESIGRLRYRHTRGRVHAGKIAGHVHGGNLQIMYRGKRLQVARLVWMWHYGDVPDKRRVTLRDNNPENVAVWNLRLLAPQIKKGAESRLKTRRDYERLG